MGQYTIPGFDISGAPDGELPVESVDRFGMPRLVRLGLNWTF